MPHNTPTNFPAPDRRHLPEQVQRYLADPKHAPMPPRFVALPLAPSTVHALGLWGGVYEVFPHGLTARCLAYERDWALAIAKRLNRLAGPPLPAPDMRRRRRRRVTTA